jgi:hypothetical protein
MTPQFAKSSSIHDSARCNHRFPNGMRCGLLGFGSQPFCPKHTQPAAAPPPPNPAEVASTLTANLDDFTSAAQINVPLAPAPSPRARQNLYSPRRRPRLHHQPTPAHPPRHCQRGKRPAHYDHRRHARSRQRAPCARRKSGAAHRGHTRPCAREAVLKQMHRQHRNRSRAMSVDAWRNRWYIAIHVESQSQRRSAPDGSADGRLFTPFLYPNQ